ncbi:hypothetical protein GWI33_019005 [Rhynchophorus ferrugineus]|uniref:Uncharacterized protein n=1 Tax=Rhynchophorus ferrugineus TaxID=354439 RepID=A0A834HVS3_RHYFE|nr:hypothetical protein GWI33_019005 [Rhynchophorus ferrugineus]
MQNNFRKIEKPNQPNYGRQPQAAHAEFLELETNETQRTQSQIAADELLPETVRSELDWNRTSLLQRVFQSR